MSILKHRTIHCLFSARRLPTYTQTTQMLCWKIRLLTQWRISVVVAWRHQSVMTFPLETNSPQFTFHLVGTGPWSVGEIVIPVQLCILNIVVIQRFIQSKKAFRKPITGVYTRKFIYLIYHVGIAQCIRIVRLQHAIKQALAPSHNQFPYLPKTSILPSLSISSWTSCATDSSEQTSSSLMNKVSPRLSLPSSSSLSFFARFLIVA